MPQDLSAATVPEAFDITRFLLGRTRAWGIFEDRFGHLRRRFDVEMEGRWEGDAFLLAERFVYDTGETEARTWRLKRDTPGRFTATCADCVGEARGVSSADTIRMSYTFRLKLATRTLTVHLDDRIYRLGDGIAMNRATMRKWGIRIGELSLFFRRDAGGESGGAQSRAA